MSNSIGFAQANLLLARPPSMSQEECHDLEVFSNGNVCISKWQLDDSEIEQLKKNGYKLYIHVIGITQPPVYVSSLDPFVEEKE